jgi:endonuclease/exonuclease/phosphatase family metal-dependent hydrolase
VLRGGESQVFGVRDSRGLQQALKLRLISANLGQGAVEPQSFAGRVKAIGPDVVAVQEVSQEQAAALVRVLREGDAAPGGGPRDVAIFLRGSAKAYPLSLGHGTAWVAEAAVEGGSIEVINMHVRAPNMLPLWRSARYRRRQLRAIEAYLDGMPPRPRVLVGDLNSTPLWPFYRRLARRLDDAALVVARRAGVRPSPTWGPWVGGPRLFRIDHIFVEALVVEDLRVIPIEGGDHSAVVADLSLR